MMLGLEQDTKTNMLLVATKSSYFSSMNTGIDTFYPPKFYHTIFYDKTLTPP